MEFKIIMAFCAFPTLVIMYGLLYFYGNKSKGFLFGVTLWEEAEGSLQVRKIQKAYKRELGGAAFFLLLLYLVTLAVDYESLVLSGQMLWTILVLVVMYVPFIRANKRLLGLKRESYDAMHQAPVEGQKRFVDMAVAAAASQSRVPFKKLFLWGGIFATAPALAECFLYDSWWNPQGPGLWIRELVLASIAAASLTIPAVYLLGRKQRLEVLTDSSPVNVQLARMRWYHLGKALMLLEWMFGFQNWGMLVTFHLPAEWAGKAAIGSSLLVSAASLALLVWYGRMVGKNTEKCLSQALAIPRDEEDDHWIWGLFYYNKEDSRTMVEQRVGIGVAYNLAKPAVRNTAIALVFGFVIFLFGCCAWAVLEEFTPITVSYENQVLEVRNWKKEYQIPISDIASVELLEERPKLSRKNGTAMRTILKGNFYDREGRKDVKVCLDPRNAPFLLVQTKDGASYLIGSSDPGSVSKIYQELRKAE